MLAMLLAAAHALSLAPSAHRATGGAPAPMTPKPGVAVIRATIGKTHTGKEVRALGHVLKQDPVIHYSLWWFTDDEDQEGDEEDHLFFLTWKAQGISLNVTDGKVSMVALYNKIPEGYARYQGELPKGLTFEDDLEGVQKKLGEPDKVTELPARPVSGTDREWEERWLQFHQHGLALIVRRPVGGNWTIHTIKVLALPESPKK